MDFSWRCLHSLLRFGPTRVLILFAGLGGLSAAAVNEGCAIQDAETVRTLNLDACRPEAISAEAKAAVLRMLPVQGAVTEFSAGERSKLRAIDAVLRTYARDGIYEVRVITIPQAYSGLHERAVLLLSKPALDLLTAEELQALAAHEVGHEYVWDQYASAKIRGDTQRRRDLELVCDAIAVATLARLGIPPDRLRSAIEKVFSYNLDHLGIALDLAITHLSRSEGG
jgi:hypothetical protein